jgi:mono/diheme cytochrome c family protein
MSKSLNRIHFAFGVIACLAGTSDLVSASPKTSAHNQPAVHKAVKPLGIGRTASPAEIAGWDIDIRPDGLGLPAGKGTAKQGEQIYNQLCASCHGEFGEGAKRWPPISGGDGTLASANPVKSIGSYWPFASTVMDYIRRSMPFGNAQTLSNDDLYAVTAYVLFLNDIVKDESFELNAVSFKPIRLPNQFNFYDDDRHVAEKTFWRQRPCMKNCLPGKASITSRAGRIDITPNSRDAKDP